MVHFGGEEGTTLTKLFLILFRRCATVSRPSLAGRYTSLDTVARPGFRVCIYEGQRWLPPGARMTSFSGAIDMYPETTISLLNANKGCAEMTGYPRVLLYACTPIRV